MSSSADPLSFIRIILSNNMKSARIMIPEKFTERHGRTLDGRVIMKVPNGDVWQVELMKSKDGIWLSNGWMEFAEHYSLKFGHLLMFKYQGFSIFSVFIFNPSACQIDYPKPKHQPSHNPAKVKIEAGSGSGEVEKGDAKKRAMEAVKAKFTSDYPFFTAYMTPNHIAGNSNVFIPRRFINEHWSGLKRNQMCLLQVGSKTYESSALDVALRLHGWKMLMRDNGVSVHDVCAFELIDNVRNLIRVTILRASSNWN